MPRSYLKTDCGIHGKRFLISVANSCQSGTDSGFDQGGSSPFGWGERWSRLADRFWARRFAPVANFGGPPPHLPEEEGLPSRALLLWNRLCQCNCTRVPKITTCLWIRTVPGGVEDLHPNSRCLVSFCTHRCENQVLGGDVLGSWTAPVRQLQMKNDENSSVSLVNHKRFRACVTLVSFSNQPLTPYPKLQNWYFP